LTAFGHVGLTPAELADVTPGGSHKGGSALEVLLGFGVSGSVGDGDHVSPVAVVRLKLGGDGRSSLQARLSISAIRQGAHLPDRPEWPKRAAGGLVLDEPSVDFGSGGFDGLAEPLRLGEGLFDPGVINGREQRHELCGKILGTLQQCF
jgi:hypothetical protein